MTTKSEKGSAPAIPPIKAIWYSGVLEFPDGECIESFTRRGCGATYERDILLHVEEGRVVKKETRNNLTLDFLADLWVRAEMRPFWKSGLRDEFWKLMEKSSYWNSGDECWRSHEMPPPQLVEPIAEVRARREDFLSRFSKDNGKRGEYPLFLRARAD